MLSIALALRLAVLTVPLATEPSAADWKRYAKILPAKSWEYKVREDLRQSRLFPLAFPTECYPRPERASDGGQLWTRIEFGVFTQRVVFLSRAKKEAVSPLLQKEIQRLETEFRPELRLLEKTVMPSAPEKEQKQAK